MLTVDGSRGEGGGQIFRSALSLSMASGRPVRVENIRSGRESPGLRAQHLTALRAAAEVARADVEGDRQGSRTVVFRPDVPHPGRFTWSTGGAGSATLVLQTVLPALLEADGPSEVEVEGGTHNPWAPPYDFLERAFVPLVRRLGADIELELLRPGFYPAGGGRIRARVRPAPEWKPLRLRRRGRLRACRVRALVSALPRHIAEREVEAVREALDPALEEAEIVEVENPAGPGNAVVLVLESEEVTEVFTGFGRRGVPAERVASGAAEEANRYLRADVPVGPYLADQLLLPLAFAAGGAFRTVESTPHAETQTHLLRRLLDAHLDWRQDETGAWEVEVEPVSRSASAGPGAAHGERGEEKSTPERGPRR